MAIKYKNDLKKRAIKQLSKGIPRKKVALRYNVPLKTLEKWITANNKGILFVKKRPTHRKYDKEFKKKITALVVEKRESTIKTAEKYDVPLKTLENWITEYNKDKTCFD